MKHVIIRDDDISFFTPADVLETLYRPLLSHGGCASLSVIPAISCGIKVNEDNGPFWTRYKMEYSPFIPPEYRAITASYNIGDNQELVRYINDNPGFEVVQHGYNHARINGCFECKLSDIQEIEKKLRESGKIMSDAFGGPADFFVGPWDAFSPETIRCLKKHFKGISMYRMGKRHMPWHLKPAAVMRKLLPYGRRKGYFLWGDFVIFEHPGTFVSMFNKPENILPQIKEALNKVDILVIVTHHWEFFHDWNSLNMPFFRAWLQVIDYLLTDKEISITGFSRMYREIAASRGK